ncbi:MAG: adaptor protein MecA [Lachnospiraceae bacterium]|nr:adaptor protein MecA [Lachnospiraceae bacterium]
MKIERIDDKTVKCFISNEELEELEITYKDFILRSEKAKEVVEDIIEQAVEEVGYKPPEFAMDMQIMMMPDKGMILTLSERTPEDLKKNPMLQEYLKEVQKTLEEHFPNIAAIAGKAAKESTAEEPLQEKSVQEKPDYALFVFDSIKQLSDYASVLPKNLRMISILYRMDGNYYLYLQKGGASYERYSRACIHALEYGVLYGAAEDKLRYLQEHGECIIEDKAIVKLRLS